MNVREYVKRLLYKFKEHVKTLFYRVKLHRKKVQVVELKDNVEILKKRLEGK